MKKDFASVTPAGKKNVRALVHRVYAVSCDLY